MAGVSVEVIDTVTPKLNAALKSFTDFKRPLELAGHYMFRETMKQFETRGAHQAPGADLPWKPLSKRTIARRRKKSDAPLQDTGRLRASVGSKARASIYELGRDYLRMGTNLEYARIHQKGGTINRVTKAGSVRLRTLRSGAVRFASKRHKNVRVVSYAGGKPYSITIPARPFLVVTARNRQYINREIFRRWMLGAFK